MVLSTFQKVVLGVILLVVLVFAIYKPLFGIGNQIINTTTETLGVNTDVAADYAQITVAEYEGYDASKDVQAILASGEYVRERKTISKQEFISALETSYLSVTGTKPSDNQLKALYAITILEMGAIGQNEIVCFNWNCGNLHVANFNSIYLKKDLGLSPIYERSQYSQQLVIIKEYVAKNNIKLPTTPYFWSVDSNGKSGDEKEYCYVPFQAFDSAAEGLNKEITLIFRSFPDAINDAKLSDANSNAEKAAVVAHGLKFGVPWSSGGQRSYYESNEDSYAKGLVNAMAQYDTITE